MWSDKASWKWFVMKLQYSGLGYNLSCVVFTSGLEIRECLHLKGVNVSSTNGFPVLVHALVSHTHVHILLASALSQAVIWLTGWEPQQWDWLLWKGLHFLSGSFQFQTWVKLTTVWRKYFKLPAKVYSKIICFSILYSVKNIQNKTKLK